MALKYDVVRADFEYLEKVCENGGDFFDIHAEITSVLMKHPTKKTATHFYHLMILEWFSCIETKKMNDIGVPRSVLSDSRVINIAERYMVDLSEQEAGDEQI